MGFEIVLVLVSVLAGGVAALSGFGIGSLLTPLLSLEVGTKIAVAVISIPHFIGTLLRFWMLRKNLDWKLLLHFGIWSAVGGLLGALSHTVFGSGYLALVLGVLLAFAGLTGVTGFSDRLRITPRWAWLAGFASGAFGGLVGNQGGIRSAALLSFNIRKEAFVATATAIALIVDIARMPVYFSLHLPEIRGHWNFVLLATLGVVAGTLAGKAVLGRVPEKVFRKAVYTLILLLGLSMVAAAALRMFPD